MSLGNVINDIDERPHWLKFLSQAIVYNDVTHKKVFNKVTTYKTLTRKCKENVRSLAQRLVDSEKRFITKEINNEDLQTKLKDVQTQLANVRMQREDNMATPTATATKYKWLQQQIENMQSQLDNAHVYQEDSMATITKRQYVTYVLSRMKLSFFDKIAA